MNNREREEPDGSFFVGRVIRVYIVVFVLGAGFGLALGFYAGLIASKCGTIEYTTGAIRTGLNGVFDQSTRFFGILSRTSPRASICRKA